MNFRQGSKHKFAIFLYHIAIYILHLEIFILHLNHGKHKTKTGKG